MISAVNWEGVAYLEQDYDEWEETPPQYDGNLPDPLEAYRYRHSTIPIRPYDQPMFTFKLDAYCGRSCLCGGGLTNLGERGYASLAEHVSMLDLPQIGPTMAEVDALRREIQVISESFRRTDRPSVGDAVHEHPANDVVGNQRILSGIPHPRMTIVDEAYEFTPEMMASAAALLNIDDQLTMNGEAFVVVSTNDDGSVSLKPLGSDDG